MPLDRNLEIKYLGHSTFMLTTPAGRKLALDPWIRTNPRCPEGDKRLDGLDTMLISHGHFDHLADAVDLARRFEPRIGCMFELGAWLESKGVKNVSGMNKGGTQQLNDVRVTMVNAHHSSSFTEEDGTTVYLGEPAGYVIEFEDGFRVYFAGDTCVFGDMSLIGELYRPELAFLPIGDFYTMGPREAAHACRLLDVRKVIPMHYGTFPVLSGTPEELAELTRDLDVEILALQPGQTLK